MWESVISVGELTSMNDEESIVCVGELNEPDTIPFQLGLVMACLNINSLLAHIDELRITMNNNKLDHDHIHSTNHNIVFEWSISHKPFILQDVYIEHTNESIVLFCLSSLLVCSI